MSAAGGGGASIIAAYAVIRNFIRACRTPEEEDARARLDAEELREVEYAAMGLPLPEHASEPTARPTFLGRLLGSSDASGFHRSG